MLSSGTPRERIERWESAVSQYEKMLKNEMNDEIRTESLGESHEASGCYIMENQHEEQIMRDIHVSKRGSEAASEEQSDKLRKTVRFGQEASSAAASSDPTVTLEYPASGETQDRPRSVLVQKSGHVDDDVQISALDACCEKDGRRTRYVGEVLERYQGEDAGDLKRIELVEKWTRLNVLEKKTCKLNPKILMEEKSWRSWKSNQNIVLDEELVQNVVKDEELIQNMNIQMGYSKMRSEPSE